MRGPWRTEHAVIVILGVGCVDVVAREAQCSVYPRSIRWQLLDIQFGYSLFRGSACTDSHAFEIQIDTMGRAVNTDMFRCTI